MLKILYIVLLVFVTPTVLQIDFHECYESGGSEAHCENVKPIDLAIMIDHSIYRPGETEEDIEAEFRKKFHKFYREFLRSFDDVTGFLYLPNKFRRAIGTTNWNEPFYVMRQTLKDADYPKKLNPPYQTPGVTPTTKSGLGELLSEMYVEELENGKRDEIIKVAVVLTRGTTSDEDEDVIVKMNNLMSIGYKIYVIFFTGKFIQITELTDIFYHQSAKVPLKNYELFNYYLGHANKSDDLIPKCICSFLVTCLSVDIHCGYVLKSDGGEDCAGTNRSCVPYCQKAKCDTDCELKGWTEWSECVQGVRTRKRVNENAGYSEFTPSCPKELTEKCDVKTSTTLIGIFIGCGVAFIVIVILIVVGIVCCRRKRSKGGKSAKESSIRGSGSIQQYEMLTAKSNRNQSMKSTKSTKKAASMKSAKSAKNQSTNKSITNGSTKSSKKGRQKKSSKKGEKEAKSQVYLLL